jgi:hypothetical protein
LTLSIIDFHEPDEFKRAEPTLDVSDGAPEAREKIRVVLPPASEGGP